MFIEMENGEFWLRLDELVDECELVIDRPKGSLHPRYSDFAYPLDYGYLEGTQAADGDGIDVWVGSLPDRAVVGVVCTIDRTKRDAEVKILLGCTAQEAQQIVAVHSTGEMAAIFVERPKFSGGTEFDE
jgi:inorganic pyrophosphatase